jgi:hypothetical protein
MLIHQWYIRIFVGSFAHWIAFLPVAVIGAVVLVRLGSGLGLDRLFWSDSIWVRLRVGVFLGLLLITSMVVGFLLDHPSTESASGARLVSPFGTLTGSCIRNLICFSALGLIVGFVGWLFSRAPKPLQRQQQAQPEGRTLFDWVTLVGPALIAGVVFIIVAWSFSCRLDPLLNAPPSDISGLHRFLLGVDRLVNIKRLLFHQPPMPDDRLAVHVIAIFLLAYWSLYFLLETSNTALLKSTPGIGLCFLAAVVILFGGLIQFNSVPGILPLGVFLLFGMIRAKLPGGIYTFRIRGLKDAYAKPVMLEFKGAPTPPQKPGADGDPPEMLPCSKGPLHETGHEIHPPSPDEPLVIVCCSGGGIRSAVWTLRCLTELENAIPTFASRTRIVFGASGGMLGATRWVTGHASRPPVSSAQMIKQVEKDALSRLTSTLIFRDIPLSLLPISRPWQHRGNVIEDNWKNNFESDGTVFNFKFEDLKTLEEKGAVPSLVYSPMMVEDARRLLISNLDLSYLCQVYGPELRRDFAGTTLYSQSALEFRSLFGQLALDQFDLLTAVRLNASFPYVMPPSSLPTLPRRRVVDAGYYDNYGVGLAADWLLMTLQDQARWQWLRNNASGVIVVQLRDGVLNLTQPLNQSMANPGKPSALLHATEPLTAPIQGLMGFKNAVQLFDNDVRLSRVLGLLNKKVKSEHPTRRCEFATSVAFEFASEASLTWALSEQELENLAWEANPIENINFGERCSDARAWWLQTATP